MARIPIQVPVTQACAHHAAPSSDDTLVLHIEDCQCAWIVLRRWAPCCKSCVVGRHQGAWVPLFEDALPGLATEAAVLCWTDGVCLHGGSMHYFRPGAPDSDTVIDWGVDTVLGLMKILNM